MAIQILSLETYASHLDRIPDLAFLCSVRVRDWLELADEHSPSRSDLRRRMYPSSEYAAVRNVDCGQTEHRKKESSRERIIVEVLYNPVILMELLFILLHAPCREL